MSRIGRKSRCFEVHSSFLLCVVLHQFCANACLKREIYTLIAKDHRLNNSVIYERQVDSLLDCTQLCLSRRPRCRSINYEKIQSNCELNSQTRTSKPGQLLDASQFNYFEPIPIRSVFHVSPEVGEQIVFKGVYQLKNVRSKRFLFSGGGHVTGERGSENGTTKAKDILNTDGNYYNRALWIIRYQGQDRYLFENHETKRYLFAEGDEISGDRGCEGGISQAPRCVGSDENYHDRAFWRIVSQGDGKYFIENFVNFRFVFSTGEPPTRSEGGWHNPRKCIMSDANYENRALWEITKFF